MTPAPAFCFRCQAWVPEDGCPRPFYWIAADDGHGFLRLWSARHGRSFLIRVGGPAGCVHPRRLELCPEGCWVCPMCGQLDACAEHFPFLTEGEVCQI